MESRVQKACEIRDAKISFVSLVDKAANKRQFLITKAENGNANWQTVGRIIEKNSKSHVVTGIVYEPLVEDAHGDFMSEEEITKAAYWFAKNGNSVDVQHSFKPEKSVSVVENWIAKADFEVDGEPVHKGTWLITAEVQDDALWDKIEKGEITGFSMGGQGKYSEKDVDLDRLEKHQKPEDKQGLLSKLAKALGFKTVIKGKVAEIYSERSKSTLFWEALHSLESCLFHYDPFRDEQATETDETRIRECLTEFSDIVTDILTSDQKATEIIYPVEVEKAGKKLSGRNKEALRGIYESLGAFLKEFDDPEQKLKEQEESEMTKEEIVALIQENIRSAFEEAGITTKAKPEDPENPEKPEEDSEKVQKAEWISAAVQSAVEKALASANSNTEAQRIQQMISDAVEKAVAPIRKQTGLPSNLNDSNTSIKKNEQHYLHGIL